MGRIQHHQTGHNQCQVHQVLEEALKAAHHFQTGVLMVHGEAEVLEQEALILNILEVAAVEVQQVVHVHGSRCQSQRRGCH